jgi:hypothetical protein
MKYEVCEEIKLGNGRIKMDVQFYKNSLSKFMDYKLAMVC